MPRPPIEVADVIRAAGDSFYERSRTWFTWLHLKLLNAILRCRTAALGGHVDACSGCGHQVISFNSCRNRHCPKCQANARDRWLEARGKRTTAHTLRPRGLYSATSTFTAGPAEQTRDLQPIVPSQRRDTAADRPRPEALRRGDRIFQRSPHLGSETPASSARSLRRSGGRFGSGPRAVD